MSGLAAIGAGRLRHRVLHHTSPCRSSPPMRTATAAARGVALAFIAYAGTLIVTAPLLGGLSDRVGRKPCVLAGLALAGCPPWRWWSRPPADGARRRAGAAGRRDRARRRGGSDRLGGRAGRRAGSGPARRARHGLRHGGFLWRGRARHAHRLLAARRGGAARHLLAAHGRCRAAHPIIARLPDRRPNGARRIWLRVPAFPRGTVASSFGMFAAWGVTGVTITSVPSALAAAGYPRLGPLAVCFMIIAGTAVQQAIGRWPARRLSLTACRCGGRGGARHPRHARHLAAAAARRRGRRSAAGLWLPLCRRPGGGVRGSLGRGPGRARRRASSSSPMRASACRRCLRGGRRRLRRTRGPGRLLGGPREPVCAACAAAVAPAGLRRAASSPWNASWSSTSRRCPTSPLAAPCWRGGGGAGRGHAARAPRRPLRAGRSGSSDRLPEAAAACHRCVALLVA